jgi:predicted dienelactone hydrolase
MTSGQRLRNASVPGTGGTHLGYRLLAGHLAESGYIVVMPEHPGNNRNNGELAGTAENVVNRARQCQFSEISG